MVQDPGLVCPRLRPLPSHSFPQTLHDLQIKFFIDSLTTWNKLMMNNTLPIKKKKTINVAFTFERLCSEFIVVGPKPNILYD